MTPAELNKLATLIAEKVSTGQRWLKLSQATKYSCYGKDRLKKLAINNLIKGYQDPESKRGDWIFDKESIDEFRIGHMAEHNQKVLSILASL